MLTKKFDTDICEFRNASAVKLHVFSCHFYLTVNKHCNLITSVSEPEGFAFLFFFFSQANVAPKWPHLRLQARENLQRPRPRVSVTQKTLHMLNLCTRLGLTASSVRERVTLVKCMVCRCRRATMKSWLGARPRFPTAALQRRTWQQAATCWCTPVHKAALSPLSAYGSAFMSLSVSGERP